MKYYETLANIFAICVMEADGKIITGRLVADELNISLRQAQNLIVNQKRIKNGSNKQLINNGLSPEVNQKRIKSESNNEQSGIYEHHLYYIARAVLNYTSINLNSRFNLYTQESATKNFFVCVYEKYQGIKKSVETEYKVFLDNVADAKDVAPKLLAAYERELAHRALLKRNGQFVPKAPYLSNWIKNRHWEIDYSKFDYNKAKNFTKKEYYEFRHD